MLIFDFFSFSSPHEGKGKEPENKMTKEEEEKIKDQRSTKRNKDGRAFTKEQGND